MKKFVIAAVVTALFSFMPQRQTISSISGIVTPSEAASKVWAIGTSDTVSTVLVNGKFTIPVKEGVWNIVVEAIAPYQNATMSGIVVIDGQPNDIGTIVLKKSQ